MVRAYCEDGWWKDSKAVTGREIRRREKEDRLNLSWIDDVELHLRVKV